jgi:hypothetical protein
MTGVVLGPQDRDNEKLIYAHIDPARPDSWKKEPVRSYLNDIVLRGGTVEIISGEKRFVISEPI